MAQSEKVAAVAELTEQFRESSAAVLTEYRGLTTAELTSLRRSLGATTTYAIVKNTLTKRAASEAGVAGLDDLLKGPTAIAFVGGDPVEAAKGLRDFAKASPALVIKGGVLDGRSVTPDDITKLADLDSREVMLAKLAGAMKANLSKAAVMFAAPLSKFARLSAALAEKKPAEAPEAQAADVADTVDDGAANAEALNAESASAEAATSESSAADAASAESSGDAAES
jgi:large subunit ribosomal protein L10